MNLNRFRDQKDNDVIGVQVLTGEVLILNSGNGAGPYLEGGEEIQLPALKKEQNNLFRCPLFYSLSLVLQLWITNPAPLFIVEDPGAQVEIHNFILKSKSLSLIWFL